MKPFNFEEFKAGKPAKIGEDTYHFLAYDEELKYPLIVKCGRKSYDFNLNFFEENATMIPTKKDIWFPIINGKNNKIYPALIGYNSKESALMHITDWQVIDAIPYTIEE